MNEKDLSEFYKHQLDYAEQVCRELQHDKFYMQSEIDELKQVVRELESHAMKMADYSPLVFFVAKSDEKSEHY